MEQNSGIDTEGFYTESKTSQGFELTQSIQAVDPDAMMTHRFRTRFPAMTSSKEIDVVHHMSGPMTFFLSYDVTVDNARTMATYLRNAARLVENYNRGLDPEDPDDWGIGDVPVSGLFESLENCINVDLDQGHVEMYHSLPTRDQPILCHNLAPQEARHLADYFVAAADDRARQIAPATETVTDD